MHRRRRVGLVATATLVALTAASVPVAEAGTYDVVACKASGASVNRAWFGSASSYTSVKGYATDSCSSADGALKVSGVPQYFTTAATSRSASAAATAVGSFVQGRFTFTAPAGSSISRFEGTENCRFASPYVGTRIGAQLPCSASTWQSVVFSPPVGSANLSFSVMCKTSETACRSAGINFMAYQRLKVTVADSTVPTLMATGGGLVAPGWKRDTQSVAFTASDNVGIREARLAVDGSTRASAGYGCDYTLPAPCPSPRSGELTVDTRQMADGAHHRYDLKAFDTALNASASVGGELKVDNHGPSLQLSGRLRDLSGKELFAQPYALELSAADGGGGSGPENARAGVQSLEVLVDRQVAASWRQDCPAGSCGLSASWAWDPSAESIADGEHLIEVRATDHAGNVTSQSWTVIKAPIDPLPTEDELYDTSLGLRQEEGLRSDPAYIRSLLNDPAYDHNRDVWGVPLTDEEAATLDGRRPGEDSEDSTPWDGQVYDPGQAQARSSSDSRPSDPDPIEDYGVQHADSYAGSYTARDTVYVGFVKDAGQHLDQLRQLVAHPVALFPVTRTLAELDTLMERVTGDDAALQAQGVRFTSVSVDIPGNVVEVGVEELTAAVEATLQSRYGPAVRAFSEGPIVEGKRRRDYWNPVIAGIAISYGDRGEHICTGSFAFLGQYLLQGNQTFRGQMTAGHCGEAAPNALWYQGGQPLGQVTRREFRDGGRVDAAMIEHNRQTLPDIYITPRTVQRYRSIQKPERERIGDDVCHSGRTKGPLCGKLNRTDANVRVKDRVLRKQRRMRPYSGSGVRDTCAGGDSGGPVYWRSVAKGIVSSIAKRSRYCYYGALEWAIDDLGLTVAR